MDLSLKFKADLDQQLLIKKVNIMLAELKKSLGSFGTGVSILDEKSISSQFAKVAEEFGKMENGANRTKTILKGMGDEVKRAADSGTLLGKAFMFTQVTQAVGQITQAFQQVVQAGIEYESSLQAVGAITGLTGKPLEALGQSARDLAKEFGGSASSQLASFQGILSKLGPAVANTPEALGLLAKNVNLLSAASGDDAATSMNAIVDSMLQFGLVTGDSMKDAETSTRIINGLAASATVGAAEIPQVAAAILSSGVAAKGANQSFEQMNAAIQVLAVGGKTGSEAGVALRNVMGLLQNASGPAEAAFKSMGLSSKELGETLNKEGLNEAMKKIKEGMNSFGSDAERNAALMKIFGMENASAAGILMDNTDAYQSFLDGIKAGQEGTGAAFEQASMRMDTAGTQMEIWKAKVNDAFIGLTQTMGQGLTATIGFAGTMQPLISSIAGLGSILPTNTIVKFTQSLINTLVPGLITTATAQTGLATATTGATAAQSSFNAAALLNPYVLAVAGIVAMIAATKLLSDALHETAVEKLDDAKADNELLKSKIENNRQQRELVTAQISLVDSFEKQGAAAMDNANLMVNLAKSYPGVIDQSKSYEENLKKLKSATSASTAELSKLDGEMQQLASQSIELNVKMSKLEVDVAKGEIESQLADAFGGVGDSVQEWIFGTSDARIKGEDIVKPYTNAIYKAKDDAGLKKASLDFQLAVFNDDKFKDLDAKQKTALIANIKQMTDAKRKALETENRDLQKDMADFQSAGFKQTEVVDLLSKKYGKSKEEVQAMLTVQKAGTSEISKATGEVAKLGDAWNAATAKVNENIKTGLAGVNELSLKLQDKSLTKEKRAELQALYNQEMSNLKKQAKEKQNLDNIDEQNQIKSTIREAKKEKNTKSAFELAKQEFENQKKRIDNEVEVYEITAETNRLTNERSKTLIDDIALQNEKNKAIELEKKKFIEIYDAKLNADGKIVSIGLTIGKDKNMTEVLTDLNNQLDDITNEASKGKNASLELKAKVITSQAELQQQLKEYNIEKIKFEIDLGLKTSKDLLPVLEDDFKVIEQKIAEKELAIAQMKDRIVAEAGVGNTSNQQLEYELAEMDKSLIELKTKEMTSIKEMEGIKKTAREESLKNLQEQHKKELDEYEKKATLEAKLSLLATNIVNAGLNTEADSIKNAKLKDLETQKEAEIISETQYNLQKEQIELDYQNRIQVIQEAQRGAELEAERQQTLRLLEEKRKRLGAELDTLDPIADKARYDEINTQLTDITTQIKDKGDLLQAYSEELQGNMSEIFVNLLGGNEEGLKDSARKMFAVVGGILKKAASAAATKLILDQLMLTPGGLLALIATPVIGALVNVAISKIVDPIIAGITSFSTGGRVDEPTLAVVGDAANARRGSNTEWVLRDDHLNLIISMALAKNLDAFKSIIPELVNQINFDKKEMSNWSVDSLGKLVDSRIMDYELFDKSINKLNRSLNNLPTELKNNLNFDEILKISIQQFDIQNLDKQFHSGKMNEDDYLIRINEKQRKIKSYASGSGFLYQPELAVVGDAGINNPEVVLNSQNLKDLIQRVGNTNNSELLSTMRNVENLLSQLLNKDSNVYLDGSKVTDEVQREFNRRKYNK